MNKKTVISRGHRTQREFSPANWRAGVAKDQLIFIIICSVAMAVAVGTLVYFFTSRSNRAPGEWQCLKCDHKFSKKITEMPPIYCPKCGAQAARLYYRICPECKKENVVCRICITGEAAQMAGGEQRGSGPGFELPSQIQYRIKQSDGSYAWTEWMSRASPQAQQFTRHSVCTKCGANLYGQPTR